MSWYSEQRSFSLDYSPETQRALSDAIRAVLRCTWDPMTSVNKPPLEKGPLRAKGSIRTGGTSSPLSFGMYEPAYEWSNDTLTIFVPDPIGDYMRRQSFWASVEGKIKALGGVRK